jgi:hypothetical protein
VPVRVFQLKVPTFALEVRNGQRRLIRLPQSAHLTVDASVDGQKEIEVGYEGTRVMVFVSDLSDRADEVSKPGSAGGGT